MTLAVVRSRALEGMTTREVLVEVHLANGLPGFTLVGLADTEVRESRERVRAALAESGFAFPHNRRVTVNLAPADLPKESGRYDLPMALGILAASGQLDPARLQGCEFAGELSLAGQLRPVRGALALALAARRDGCTRALVLPAQSAQIAARVPDVEVRGASDLLQVARALAPGAGGLAELPRAHPPGAHGPPSGGSGAGQGARAACPPDLRDVRGQAGARRALEVAAAGAHPLLLIGPPGSGKSMLAQRLPSILPPLEAELALESAALHGLAGSAAGPGGPVLDAAGNPGALGTPTDETGRAGDPAPFGRRPVRTPHHSASAVALVGGGSPPRPGEISLAHAGVLFLDELPEFPRAALEALREPLETGRVTLSRAGRQAQYPAAFQLVAAMNPCPCGWLGSFAATGKACRCTAEAVARYQGRISGPLLDRIDLVVDVPAQRPDALLDATPAEDSAVVAARVAAARARMLERQGVPNGQLDASALGAGCALEEAARNFLGSAAQRLGWSGRAVHRVQKVARTIADLAGAERIGTAHVAEAVQWRRAIEQP